jgi:SAM-dependent methyltransferase
MLTSLIHKLSGRLNDWRDAALDRAYGIETCDLVPAPRGDGEHPAHGYHYEPIQLAVFRRIMAALAIDPKRYTFVDYGSGKGRALLLAAEYGFRRIIGVEYASALHEVARRNVARFRAANPAGAAIELHCADAASFELPHDDSVCFLYNPFDDVVMRKVLSNIERSLQLRPRRVLIVYRNPKHASLLSECRFLRCLARNATFEIHEARQKD